MAAQIRPWRPPFAVYWRNPKTRTFERIPNVSVIGYVTERHAFPVEISPGKRARWYTIENSRELEE